MRVLALAIVVAVAACTQPPPSVTPTPAPTRDTGTINVTVLLDLSGARLPSGAAQRDALQLWADEHANSVPRLRLNIVDVAGSESKTLIELRRAAVEERADAIIVGVTLRYDGTFAQAAQLTGLPVIFTLPIADPGSGWAFALAPTPAQLARATLDDAAKRTVLTNTLVVTDESEPAIVERTALADDLASRGVVPTIAKVTSDDATAKVRTLLASAPVAIFAGPPKTYVAGIRAAAPGALVYLSYLCDIADVGDLRDVAPAAAWPGSRWIAAGAAPSPPRASFVQAFSDRAGPPTTAAATAYDALSILTETFGPDAADAATMRDRIQRGTVAGVATTYSFTSTRHAGFSSSDLAMLRYTGARTPPALR